MDRGQALIDGSLVALGEAEYTLPGLLASSLSVRP